MAYSHGECQGAPATVPEPTTVFGLLAVAALTATSALGSRE
ncbi:PEP-CTERM sorting domain-containing protein [Moorena sp. SIO3H5]|nr:PEP-CTERM sorting domain-containing protein [Moorena sp. SIO3H5]